MAPPLLWYCIAACTDIGDFKSAGPTLGDGGELMLATGEGLLGKGPPEGGKLPPTALVEGSELVLEECGIGIIGCWAVGQTRESKHISKK